MSNALPVPNPRTTARPDSSFSSIILIHGEKEWLLTGEYRNARIHISDVDKLVIKDLRLFDCDVKIAGSPHTATNVFIRDGVWNVYPSPVARERMLDPMSWVSATNFTWIGGDHKTTFNGGKELQTITVPLDQLKNGKDATPYAVAKWTFRDSTGKLFNATFWDWTIVGTNAVIRLSPRGAMAPGPGFWSCVNPNGYIKNLKYTNIDADGMDYFDIYFADGVNFTKAKFGGASVDGNLIFEYCANVTLDNVISYGNQTVQGNGADVAFLQGIDGLTVKNCEISTLAITSSGWKVANVNSDNPISWLDTGWVGQVIEQGVLKRDARGVLVPVNP